MIKTISRDSAVPAVTSAPACGGMCDGSAPAERPMVYHIGHISPEIDKTGHTEKGVKVVFPAKDGELTVEVWNKHVKIKRPSHVVYGKRSPRGKVNGLSFRASYRLKWAIENTPEFCTKEALFICLTYPLIWPEDGREVKRHLDVFGKRCRRIGVFFAWALEYQSRGAPHFHLIARFPDDWTLKKVREWIALNWYEVVGSGDKKHFRAGTSAEWVRNPDCVGWYVSNYLGKQYQKKPPEGVNLPGRMWGMIGIKPPKPQIKYFKEGSQEGIKLVRLIRRWATSDHAFRQRTKKMPIEDRIDAAEYLSSINPELSKKLRDFHNVNFTSLVKPKDRKSWSPRDAGREKGFSVRNAAGIAKQLIEMKISLDEIMET